MSLHLQCRDARSVPAKRSVSPGTGRGRWVRVAIPCIVFGGASPALRRNGPRSSGGERGPAPGSWEHPLYRAAWVRVARWQTVRGGKGVVMTECDSLTSTDPDRMLAHLSGRVSDRKLRLFALACCRRIGPLLEERSRT